MIGLLTAWSLDPKYVLSIPALSSLTLKTKHVNCGDTVDNSIIVHVP